MDKEYFHGLTTEDARQDRCVLRGRLLFWAVVVGLAIASAFYASWVGAAEFSSEDQDGKLTITKEPCTLAGPWFSKWRSARWFFCGKLYDACWSMAQTQQGGQTIVVIDSDGSVSQVDPRRFKPDEGV